LSFICFRFLHGYQQNILPSALGNFKIPICGHAVLPLKNIFHIYIKIAGVSCAAHPVVPVAVTVKITKQVGIVVIQTVAKEIIFFLKLILGIS
jgi:hypothetical protein